MNKIEIKISVTVRGNDSVDWINIMLTENDLIELAKTKALQTVDSSEYDTAECDEISKLEINY